MLSRYDNLCWLQCEINMGMCNRGVIYAMKTCFLINSIFVLDLCYAVPTISTRGYQWVVESVRSRDEIGSLTSPKKLFFPNQLLSHTHTLSVCIGNSDSFTLY